MNDQEIPLRQFAYPSELFHRTLRGNRIGLIVYVAFALLCLFGGLNVLRLHHQYGKDDQLFKDIVLTLVVTTGVLGLAYMAYSQSKDPKTVKVYKNGLGITTIRGEDFFLPWDEITKTVESAYWINIHSKNLRSIGVHHKLNDFDEFREILLKNTNSAKHIQYTWKSIPKIVMVGIILLFMVLCFIIRTVFD